MGINSPASAVICLDGDMVAGGGFNGKASPMAVYVLSLSLAILDMQDAVSNQMQFIIDSNLLKIAIQAQRPY